MKKLGLVFIELYQRLISPLFPSSCRFYPTCSGYAHQAIEKYGFFPGMWRGMIRLAKCHPLHPGGLDPVD